jgi:branched-chain amino acid transport system substrate-binding protein
MKRFYLSAAVVAAALALPALPALAQTNEITIGISITTTGPAAALPSATRWSSWPRKSAACR